MMQRHMPIGYKIVDGKVELDTEKVAVVMKIYSDYIKGASMLAIAKELTNTGFLNANNKSNWNHGSVGKILQNIKYLGDTLYPQIIDKETFESVQIRRKLREQTLGRMLQPNSMKNQSIFSGKLKCGECGDIYRKYIEHAGKSSQKSNWKCKKYIYKNKVLCINRFLTEEDIEKAFISATNQLCTKKRMLEKQQKKEPLKMTLELRKIEQRIKELEEDQQFFSNELSKLIFKRATLYYNGAKIDDYAYNTEKIKQALADKESLTEFDNELFLIITKQITIFKDGRLQVEFINGLIVTESLEEQGKDEKSCQ